MDAVLRMFDRILGHSLALVVSLGACASSPPAAPPTFIEDDWDLAVARAQREDKPIFVDMWAPWCHSCLALKSDVLSDQRMASVSEDFVWLSLDSERATSAPFIAKFPLPALPTLWVIDARSQTPILRWVGTATAPQLIELLEDARLAYRGQGVAMDATARLLEADVAAARGDNESALAALAEALTQSPPSWSKRARAANARVFLLSKAERWEECVAVAERELANTQPGATGRADLAIGGIDCATSLEGEARTRALTSLAATARAIAVDANVLGDDRSGAWIAVVDAAKALGDTVGAKAAAEQWSAGLDADAARAKTASGRAVYDAHRMSAYLEIGQGERALVMLAQSERDFPKDYNPPARLAYTLLQLGRLDEALAASARAERLMYGPRSLRILSTKADILEKQGDRAAAAAAIEQALVLADLLPESQRSAKMVKSLSDRRAKLAAP